jgi:phosphopantothenoylcysteine decarboxylase/phosphopantothenate--cysteine ligase
MDTMNPLQDKHILLGITGSIAAYKAADLASKLTQAGALVDSILTASATEFVSPLTLQSVTGRGAFVDADLWGSEGHVLHIGLGKSADLVVIAPISANTMAKLAHGLADNLLTVTALAATCPLVIAPAMDGGMFDHPATQENLAVLLQRGVIVIGPAEGHLASGFSGKGRMVEADELVGRLRLILSRQGPLAGKNVLVTAGGTQEPVDPVRVISNRSSGKQGVALAQAALDLGAEVVLVRGPISLETPWGAKQVDVQTTDEMLAAVMDALPKTDILLMAAAVADFRPSSPVKKKIKRDKEPPEIQLEPTVDILKRVAEFKEKMGRPQVTVGFAAESDQLIENARAKLESKKLDLIAANDILAKDAGFSVDTNRITLIYSDGRSESLPLMSKSEVAERILQQVVELLNHHPESETGKNSDP